MADSLTFLTNNDLNAFSTRAAQDNVFAQLVPVVTAPKFDTRTWSTGEKIGTSAAQAFLTAALGRLASNQVADQTARVAAVLPDLYKDPLRTALPEGVDADAFNALRGAATLNNIQRKAIAAQKAEDLSLDLMKSLFGERFKEEAAADFAGRKAKNTELGKLEAFGAAGASTNLLNPAVKANEEAIDALRKEMNALPAMSEFATAAKSAQALAGALKDNSKVSDQELVKYTVRMIEPGLSVQQGESAAVQMSQSIPGAVKGVLQGALSGTTELGPQVREGIRRLAERAYNSHKSQYDKALSFYQGQAKAKGLDPERVSFLGAVPNAEDVFGTAPITMPDLGAGQPIDARSIIAQVKAKYGDSPEARAIAIEMIRSAASPVSEGGTPLG